VGFGGTGAHYCVGANLPDDDRLMFNAIADAMPDIAPISKPERLRSGWLRDQARQVDYTAKAQRTPFAH